jgi:hypothetical protein
VIVAWRRDAVGFCMVVHRLLEVSVRPKVVAWRWDAVGFCMGLHRLLETCVEACTRVRMRVPAPLESVATGVLVIYIFLDNYFHSV